LDLPEISQGLKKLVDSGKVPHALLFSGPRGAGKTSAARIIAKALSCLNNNGRGEPCNHCSNCNEIASGSFLDLIEIDGASNRGIDDVRRLRENIKLAPARGKLKIYIIDEAHMLTTEAFNALLKTLEEPPAHAIFILCTTEPEKLPGTIISRCTQFRLRKAKPSEVETALKRVAKGEKLTIEEGVLELIAKNVDGSFRDGEKILDQLAAGNEKITLVEARQLLGQVEALSPERLIEALAGSDAKEGLLEISRLVEVGADLKIYLQNLLEALRLILMSRIGVEEYEETETTKKLSFTDLKKLIENFSQRAAELKNAVIPQLPLELAVIEWTQEAGRDRPLPPVQTQPKGKGEKAVRNEVKTALPVANKPGSSDLENQGNGQLLLEKIRSGWNEILSRVRPMNHSVEALLRACRPLKVDRDILTLEVFYVFHKERLETEKCRLIVEEAATEVVGSPVKVKCLLGKRQTKSSTAVKEEIIEKVIPDDLAQDSLAAAEQIFSGKIVE